MKHSKISITVLTMAMLGNSVNCFAVSQRRQTLRPKHVTGTLITPNIVTNTEAPGETPSEDNNANDDTSSGNTTPDDNTGGDNTSSLPPVNTVDKARNERIKSIRANYQRNLNDAQLNCIGISDKLGLIQGLSIGTTVVSGVGTLAGTGALVTEIIDDKVESNKFNHDKAYIAETGLLVGTSIASAGGVVTSAVALSNMDSLISKMKDCRNNISNIKLAKAELLEEDVDLTDKTIMQMDDVINSCGGIDSSSVKNVEQIKGILIASTITSGVGTVAGVAATVTNAKAHNTPDDEANKNKKSKLALASKITTGVSAGAQTGSLVLGITTLAKVNNDKDTADNCENTLMKY